MTPSDVPVYHGGLVVAWGRQGGPPYRLTFTEDPRRDLSALECSLAVVQTCGALYSLERQREIDDRLQRVREQVDDQRAQSGTGQSGNMRSGDTHTRYTQPGPNPSAYVDAVTARMNAGLAQVRAAVEQLHEPVAAPTEAVAGSTEKIRVRTLGAVVVEVDINADYYQQVVPAHLGTEITTLLSGLLPQLYKETP